MALSDRAIAEWARSRHGIVTLAELEALGLGPRGVRHRVADGRLHRLHRGVFSVERPRQRGRWMAAVVASGPGAALSHRSAAALWGVLEERASAISVTVPRETRRQRPGLAIRCGTTLDANGVTEIDGIPCTTLSRTLLDVAGVVDRRILVRAIDRAEELQQFDLNSIAEVIAGNRARRGAGALAAAIDEWSEPMATRSEAEERFLAVVRRLDLPKPEVNVWIPLEEGDGYRPDFLWRNRRLIVEIDGRTHYARRGAFVHDRRRDRRLAAVGFQTLRYAAAELMARPDAVAAELSRLFARRR